MTILEILSYPNKELTKISTDVEIFDDSISILNGPQATSLSKFLDDMKDTLETYHGIGLGCSTSWSAKKYYYRRLFQNCR